MSGVEYCNVYIAYCELPSTPKDKPRMGGYPVSKPSFNLAAVVAETIGLAVQEESVSHIPKFLTLSAF